MDNKFIACLMSTKVEESGKAGEHGFASVNKPVVVLATGSYGTWGYSCCGI